MKWLLHICNSENNNSLLLLQTCFSICDFEYWVTYFKTIICECTLFWHNNWFHELCIPAIWIWYQIELQCVIPYHALVEYRPITPHLVTLVIHWHLDHVVYQRLVFIYAYIYYYDSYEHWQQCLIWLVYLNVRWYFPNCFAIQL